MDYAEMEKMMKEMMQDPQYQQIFWITFAVVGGIMAVIGLVTYILGAIGVRRMSANAGLPHSWLAFVPILRWSVLGRMAELRLPREVPGRKIFGYSIHLPVLMTLSTILELLYSGFSVYYTYLQPDAVIPDQLGGLINGVSMAYSVINMIAVIVLLLAIHRVFVLVGCRSATLMTLLCALISYLLPILLFAYRKNKILKPINQDPRDPDSGFYYDGQ